MANRRNIHNMIHRLAAAESEFLKTEFLAPVVRGGEVRVRIDGIVCRLKTKPDDFAGFGLFRPVDYSTAELIRPAGMAERRDYLGLLPVVKLIFCHRTAGTWYAIPAHQADARLQITGCVPVQLAETVRQFDVVRSRFDGTLFWFDAVDPRHDPATAAYLRQEIGKKTDPQKLDRRGLTPEERAAYALNVAEREAAERKAEQAERDAIEDRLRKALAHAGARFVEYAEHRDGYRVTYTVDCKRHVSSVNKNDLTVQVAGICLSGQDRKYDLNSLVGVLQESRGHVIGVGRENGGMSEEEYWRYHPPN